MKRQLAFPALSCALLVTALMTTATRQLAHSSGNAPQEAAQPGGDKFMYADFESVKENRPVSSRGGHVQLISYQESTAPKMKGAAGLTPAAPELVHLKQGDPNRAATFDYELYPNQYAGVGIQVSGQPDKDGKPVADDLSAYKYLTMQIYATGVPRLRVEVISRGVPIDGVGIQAHIFKADMKELASIKANLERLAALGLQVHVTEMDVALAVDASGALLDRSSLSTQADVYSLIAKACVEQPACTAFQTWGFTDKYTWIPNYTKGEKGAPLLFDRAYAPKPAYKAVMDALRLRKRP